MPTFTFDATLAMTQLRRNYVKKKKSVVEQEVTVEDPSAPIAFS